MAIYQLSLIIGLYYGVVFLLALIFNHLKRAKTNGWNVVEKE